MTDTMDITEVCVLCAWFLHIVPFLVTVFSIVFAVPALYAYMRSVSAHRKAPQTYT